MTSVIVLVAAPMGDIVPLALGKRRGARFDGRYFDSGSRPGEGCIAFRGAHV